MYTLDGAIGARGSLRAFDGGTVGVVIAGTPYKCPAPPYEAVFRAENFLRRQRVYGRSEVRTFVPDQQPLPVAEPLVGSAVRDLLGKSGIQYHPTFVLKEVNPDTKALSFDNGERVRLDLLLYVPPHQTPDVVANSPPRRKQWMGQ